MRRVAELIVRMSAWLAPRFDRQRWREEWLGEIDAADSRRGRDLLRRTLSAPKDALLLRASHASMPRIRGGWAADIRDAWRSWRRAPLQATLIVLSLTVASAMLLVVASYVASMHWTDLPGIRDRVDLAQVSGLRVTSFDGQASVPGFRELEQRRPAGAELGLARWTDVPIVIDGRSMEVSGYFASGGLFSVLRTRPAIGRLLGPPDDQPGAADVMVVSHAFWQRQFGGSADVLGERIAVIDSASVGGLRWYEVVGVLEPGFSGIDSGNLGQPVATKGNVWIPLSAVPASAQSASMRVLARVLPEVGWRETEAALDAAFRALPTDSDGQRRETLELRHYYFAPVNDPASIASFSILALSVPATVLILACINIAAIQIARTIARSAELATRAALGATHRRLMRLLAWDIGGLAGLAAVLAWLLVTTILPWSALVLPVALEPDWRLALAALALPLAVTIAAGWLPVRRFVTRNLAGSVRAGAADFRPRAQRVMVVAQLSLSVVLLLSGSLVLRGAQATGTRGPDVETRARVVVGGIELVQPTDDAPEILWQEMSALVADWPADVEVALASGTPLSPGGIVYAIDDVSRQNRRSVEGAFVTPGYFDVLGRRLVSGRTFTAGDPHAVVVNEAFVDERLGGAAPLGRALFVFDGERAPRQVVIVGVLAGGWGRNYLQGGSGPPPELLVPFENPSLASLTIYARSDQSEAVAEVLARRLEDVSVPAISSVPGTFGDLLDRHLAPLYWLGRVMAATSILGLALAALGLYGVISFMVARRTREFGIRYALGASPAEVGRLVVGGAIRLTMIAMAIGLGLAAPIFFVLRSAFIGVEPWDPRAIGIAVVVMAVTSLVAPLWPAWRASAVDPLAALRTE